ncbi:DUF692 domain-containing protein [Sphingomicrobium sp. B8]|uniref:DUF692 domain-containing protein n=2 Tax=Sphingomicrobium clamense TaxID=2851013 RepID=A0ABS6V6P1_9SPHN|nr:DUF692 domain-containing protein [Sphingomicrobium sp. B8]MBW0144728.1 DUF692 domain-containing protein [Sphingomicrobium sp. B8]
MDGVPPLPPKRAGLGLKPAFFEAVMDCAARGAAPTWVEVHPQNYFMDGGPMHRWLAQIRDALPVSFHSVGLSMGDPGGVNRAELDQLVSLCDRYQPALVSDHLSWSSLGGEQFPDLLPFPMTDQTLDHFADQVDLVQEKLGRPMLVENPSRMTAFQGDTYGEVDFLHALARRTGCGLLMDVNNLLVSRTNLGIDPNDYVGALDGSLIGEIHIAGHSVEDHGNGEMLAVDDHGSPVSEECWTLLDRLLDRIGPRPVLLERDNDIPDFDELLGEAERADAMLTRRLAYVA